MDPLHQDRLRVARLPWLLAIVAVFVLAAALVFINGWQAHAREWLNLIVRWLHILYGVAWIGASFYFIFLENSLERSGEGVRDELAGNLWSLHGGGLYYLEKYKTAPTIFPKTLHWFKWDAYLTWVTGFLLLVIVYYSNPRATLLAPGSALSDWAAVAIGALSLLATWFVYVALSRTSLLRNAPLFALLGLALVALAAFGLSLVFSGRGAYIHVGAMLGTIMAGNVLFVIIPSQKALVRAVGRGETLEPGFIEWVQLRSRHNNYLTLPVLFTMISNHYPMTYGHGLNWLILIVLFGAGVAVRHSNNVTERDHHRSLERGAALPYLLVLGAALVVVALVLSAPKAPVAVSTEAVEFAEVQTVVATRCAPCHAARPTQPGFTAPPAGVRLDTAAQIQAQAAQIRIVAVDSDYMPLGNLTGITEQERQLLGDWIAQGARLEPE